MQQNLEYSEEAKPNYNNVFERLFDEDAPPADQLIGLVAYGLYKIGKREWVISKGRRPTQEEFEAYASSQTRTTLAGYEAQANEIVAAYAASVVESEKPTIVESALRGTFMASVWASLLASVIFTGVLAILVVIAAISGFGLPVDMKEWVTPPAVQQPK